MIDLHKKMSMRLLLASTVFLCGTSAMAQTGAAQPQKSAILDFDASPRFEVGVFGGGQFWKLRQAHDPVPDKLVNGGVYGARFTYDFARYFGLEAGISGGTNNLRLQPVAAQPGQTFAFGARNAALWLGPVAYLTPRTSRFRPFLTVGPGFQWFYPADDAKRQARSAQDASLGIQNMRGIYDASLIWGGGVKWDVSPRFLVRVDYHGTWTEHPHFRLSGVPAPAGGIYIPRGGTEIGSEVTLGLGFRFHRPTPPPPPPAPAPPPVVAPPQPKAMTVSLNSSANEVCPGETVTVTPTTNLPAGQPASYQWTVNGEAVNQSATFEFGTSGRAAGTYTVAANVTSAGYTPGSASTSVMVREYRPPTGTVTAQPGELKVGEKSTLAASFTGQCGGTIRDPKFSASEGSVAGTTFDSTGVQFGPGGPQQKTVTITAKASDDKETGTATTTVVVKRNPMAARLPDIVFAKNSARVNNCGKRVLLDQLKTYLDQDPTGKVVFVGHIAPNEPKAAHLDRKRAENAAAVISAHKAICLGMPPSQILIGEAGASQDAASFQPYFCGASTTPVQERAGQAVSASDKNAQYRRVEVWFVPTGAPMPESVKAYKDATAYGVSKLGCPK